ncbi:zinc ribbon domain-containing protein [Elusimicrobiota bacterium]
MPVYEYNCLKCSNKFEFLLISGDEKIACPECGSEKLEKLFSVIKTITKGSECGPCDMSSHCNIPGGCCGNKGR